uniref:Uncharacterized protein n=1 Tax=uncultured Helicobacter sp. TaxID=175537 RepID=A0A650ELZ1_9HELI|nr:hypothetical protein Helico5904_1340 [uncultured Helicobacter sp.]
MIPKVTIQIYRIYGDLRYNVFEVATRRKQPPSLQPNFLRKGGCYEQDSKENLSRYYTTLSHRSQVQLRSNHYPLLPKGADKSCSPPYLGIYAYSYLYYKLKIIKNLR